MNFQMSKQFLFIHKQLALCRGYARRPPVLKIDAQVAVPKGEPDRYELNNFKRGGRNLIIEEVYRESLSNDLSADDVQDLYEKRKRQIYKMEKKMKLKTIERKFFIDPVPEPNLLTWDMKEHLLHLHSTDSQLWNSSALSEAFPASQQTIKTLLRKHHKPLSPEQLKAHDLDAIANWKAMTKDKIGNYSLLQKIINKRISQMGERSTLSLPSPAEDNPHTKGLKFTPTDDLTVEEVRGPQPSKKPKKLIPPFKDIIEGYEKLREMCKKEESGPGRPPDSSFTPQKSIGKRSQVSPETLTTSVRSPLSEECEQEYKRSFSRPIKGFNRPLTLDEYKRFKMSNLK